MWETGKTNQIATEMRRYNSTVLGITEIHWTRAGQQRLNTGEMLLHSGHEEENAPHTLREKTIGDVRTRRGANIASNHHLVVANLTLKLKKNWTTGQTAPQRFNTAFLRDTDKLNEFKITLNNGFQALHDLLTKKKLL
ncbi:unnamed protein product [Schistosoma margrebowiei]|uniref:Uncharacterized protein n=1 Tax=Schistosoma margrebowiei TaxID=48269 RepID=A0A183MCH0_9TREM|nr:unnamed protein product [Schistosoma margrebowiei]